MASTLCQKWFKKPVSCQKAQNFVYIVWTLLVCSNFTSMRYKHQTYLNKCMERLKLPMSALTPGARKSFNGKFTVKIDFPIGNFMLPLLMLTLKVLSLSIHYFLSIWTTCWWNLNKSYGPNYTKFWAFGQKMVNHFWKSVDAILKDVSVTETMVWS